MKDRAKYRNEFNKSSFWHKVMVLPKYFGKEGLEKILTLYYCFMDKKTPLWAKILIAGALGYFIAPVDVIPDFIPIAGYGDDIAVAVSAIMELNSWILESHRYQAQQKCIELGFK